MKRLRARVVAIVDLVLTILWLWLPFIALIAAVGVSKNGELPDKSEDNPESSMTMDSDISRRVQLVVVILWIVFVTSLTVLIIQFVAVAKLLNATTVGRRPAEGIKLAGFWRNWTIVFTILGITINLSGITGIDIASVTSSIYGPFFSWGSIIFRCIGVYVVHQFLSKLEKAALKGTGILPRHHGQVPMATRKPCSFSLPQQAQGEIKTPPNYSEASQQVKGGSRT